MKFQNTTEFLNQLRVLSTKIPLDILDSTHEFFLVPDKCVYSENSDHTGFDFYMSWEIYLEPHINKKTIHNLFLWKTYNPLINYEYIFNNVVFPSKNSILVDFSYDNAYYKTMMIHFLWECSIDHDIFKFDHETNKFILLNKRIPFTDWDDVNLPSETSKFLIINPNKL